MANTSIGTAWIQIKPSTKGLRQAVETGLNGAQVGSSFGQTFSASAVGAIAGVASKLAGTLMSQVKSSFDSAISRVDILNNFSNVMGNLNIGTEESQAAIDKLSDKLTGLPTRLDDAASAVQRFTTKNSNVAKSTDMFLALNNALLAGGASADLQSTALEQISQAYAKGKPDMIEWRSILQSMPAQATQIAKAFGMTADELGEALRSGDLSMDAFLDKIVELNTTGANGFKSFEEQAKVATDTIQTRIANISASITKVIAAGLNGDDMSKPIQQLSDRIVGTAPQLITGFINAFLGLAQAIPNIIPPVVDAIAAQAPAFIEAFAQIIVSIAENLPKLIQVLLDNLPTIVDAIGKALITLFDSEAFWKSAAIIGGIVFGSKLLGILGTGIKKFFAGKFANILGENFTASFSKSITGAFKTIGESIQNLLEPLSKAISTVLKNIGQGIAGFFEAFANPSILVGAGIFTVVALAIAAAILAIGKAIEWAAPGLRVLMNDIILPIANFLKDTLLALIDAMTTAIIRLTNDAIIPLGEFLMGAFLSYIQQMTESIIRVTNEAIIPLMNILSGAFTQVLQTVGNIITGTIGTALEGLRGIINAVGDGFLKMGDAVRTALGGVQGILSVFADMINSIAEGLVAIVALATHQSITYGRGYAWVTAAANGGIVRGVGTDTSDSNLYALSKGEYVVRAAAARQIGYENLDKMNRTGNLSGGTQNNYFTIEGYDKDPNELANIISRKIAFNRQGVMA